MGKSHECLAVYLRVLFWWLQHNELESKHATVALRSWRGREQGSGLSQWLESAGRATERRKLHREDPQKPVCGEGWAARISRIPEAYQKYSLRGREPTDSRGGALLGDEGGPAQLEWRHLASSTSVILQASSLDTIKAHLRSRSCPRIRATKKYPSIMRVKSRILSMKPERIARRSVL